VKLDEALKQNRVRQPTVRGVGPSAPFESVGASTKVFVPPGAWSPHPGAGGAGGTGGPAGDVSLEQQVRAERARAAALLRERDELRRLLHAAGGRPPADGPHGGGGGGGGAAVAVSRGDGSEWTLEHFMYKQVPYLLDRATLKVYTCGAGGGGGGGGGGAGAEWPEPVGRLVGGHLHVTPQHQDLFQALDLYLKREQIHLKAAYERFDADGSGALSASELGRFLQAVMPGATSPAQQRYFRAMLDINDDGKVTYAEMVTSLKECIAVGGQASAAGAGAGAGTGGGGSVEVNDVIAKLKEYVTAKRSTLHTVFAEFDKEGTGHLGQRDLVGMFTKLMPALTRREKRCLLARFAALDLDGDGKLSLAELRKALRAVFIAVVDADGGKAGAGGHATAGGAAAGWGGGGGGGGGGAGQVVLQEHVIQGTMYLLDPKRGYVYHMVSTPDEWLHPVGKLGAGGGSDGIVRPATSADLVAALDATLKQQQAVAYTRSLLSSTCALSMGQGVRAGVV
jgi:Ca2+-binding EF-hand superfamily protein